MRTLVIDTALGACTCVVSDGERLVACRSEVMSKGHAEKIGGLVRDVMAEATAGGLAGGFETLDRIGVTVGPGSFTGLRVGLAFAQGLGASLGLPVVGISTLAALAWSADQGRGLTAAVIDARRGQVYLQIFNDGAPQGEAEALDLEAARARLDRDGALAGRFAGNGAGLMVESVEDAIVNPTPEALVALTLRADPQASPPLPLYLRAPDAIPPTRLPGQPRAPVVAA